MSQKYFFSILTLGGVPWGRGGVLVMVVVIIMVGEEVLGIMEGETADPWLVGDSGGASLNPESIELKLDWIIEWTQLQSGSLKSKSHKHKSFYIKKFIESSSHASFGSKSYIVLLEQMLFLRKNLQ